MPPDDDTGYGTDLDKDPGGEDTGMDSGSVDVFVDDAADVSGIDFTLVEDLSDNGPETSWPAVPRPCEVVLSYAAGPGVTSVNVPGEWNSWNETSHPMSDPEGDGIWTVTLDASVLPAGEWGYKFLVSGTDWILDPGNPLVKYVGDDYTVNSRVIIPDCELPYLELDSLMVDWDSGSVDVAVRVFTGVGGQELDPASLVVEVQGKLLGGDWFEPATQRFVVKRQGLNPGKHSLIFRATNEKGSAIPLFVPVWLEEMPFQWGDAVLYFAMTDRFMDGDPANNAPASCLPQDHKANWLGGDFTGIRLKIEEGYFNELGVNAIWISPANDNPDGCYGGDLSLSYTAYHGYFPVSLDQTEPRFGSMDDLRDMVKAAHDRGIRVLMDLAANHVHIESDLWSLHKDWFHQDVLVCGDDDNWNDHPIDCWFQPYMPDLDYRNNDAVVAFTDAAIQWVREADLDGYRVDAVKHMIHDFSRTLRYRVQREIETSGVPFYLVGETFVSEWGGGSGSAEETIKAYISADELDGQFDFPLYWEVLKAFARGDGDMGRLAEVAQASNVFYGSDAVMSTFLGNHDVPRFVSHAAGLIADQWGNGSKELGWNDPPGVPGDSAPFDRLKQAFAFLMTVPGVPLIYYGDEVGMPGAGDPDNRRMMQFEGLTIHQTGVRTAVSDLTQVRADHPATRRGAFQSLWHDDDGLAYAVSIPGDTVLATFNRVEGRTLSFPTSGLAGVPQSGSLIDVLSGDSVDVVAGQVSVFVPKFGYRILVPDPD